MSNQKKDIADLKLAQHGYGEGIQPQTVKNIDDKITGLAADINNIKAWEQSISGLLTIPLDEFINLRYDCCKVASYLSDFPEDLLESDSFAFIFTNRSENYGIQILIGANSGFQYTRRFINGVLSDWTPTQGDTIYFATFDIVTTTGMLEMHTDPGYSGADFSIEGDNLIVTI